MTDTNAVQPTTSDKRRTIVPDTPTWKWLARGTLAGLTTMCVMWGLSIREDLASIVATSRASAEAQIRALAAQGERTASLETWRSGTDDRFRRLDSTLERVEVKVDRINERLK